MKEYQSDLTEHGKLPLGRGFKPTQHQLLIREMILQLKTGHLDAGYFEKKFQTDILTQWQSVWSDYLEKGFAKIDGRQIRLTRAGLLRVDSLLPAFFEKKHQGVRYT